jgi:hypothetical protein
MEELLLGLCEISGCQSFQQKELSQPAVEVIYIMVFLMLPALAPAGYQFAVSIQALSLSPFLQLRAVVSYCEFCCKKCSKCSAVTQ